MGIVYLATNEAMPGLVKIGTTTKDVRTRMQELTSPTGVPGQFVSVFSRRVANAREIEIALHSIFDSARDKKSNEFFRMDWKQAQIVLEMVPEDKSNIAAPSVQQAGRAETSTPEIVYFPDNEENFKQALLEKIPCKVYLRFHYSNGDVKVQNPWNVRNITEDSSIRGNLFTGRLRKYDNIVKAEVSLKPFAD